MVVDREKDEVELEEEKKKIERLAKKGIVRKTKEEKRRSDPPPREEFILSDPRVWNAGPRIGEKEIKVIDIDLSLKNC